MKLITNGVCLALYCAAALSVSGSSVFTALHEFSVFPQGSQPATPLIQARDGNFYGATLTGGTNGGFGTIFRISTSGVCTTLYVFSDNGDGAGPCGSIVQAPDGNIYGTTRRGGYNWSRRQPFLSCCAITVKFSGRGRAQFPLGTSHPAA